MNGLFFILGLVVMFLLGALPTSVQDRQYQSYRECAGVPCLAVSIESGTSSGGEEAVNEVNVTCSDTSAELAAARTTRRSLTYANLGATQVYVCTGLDPCTTAVGIPINQFIGFSHTDWTGQYTCITASGTTSVHIREIYTQ